MKKVKNILFRVHIEGQGVVNFDSSDARWNVRGYGNPANRSAYSNDNVKIAKSSYRYTGETDGEGNPVVKRTLKISSDCLRHAIFEKDYDVQNGRIMANDMLLASFISSPAALLRGYMFAGEKETLKHKSPLTITAAEDPDAVITADLGSASGDRGDKSMYWSENTGKTSYSARGSISLKGLEFLPCDDFYDRRAVKDKWIETEDGILNRLFAGRYGRVPYTCGIHTSAKETLTSHIGEYGLHFSHEFRKLMVKGLLERILGISIVRAGAYARTEELVIKPVYNGLEDGFETGTGWVKVSPDTVGEIVDGLELEDFYVPADNDAKNVMDGIDSVEKERMVKKAEDRQRKKEEKKQKKSEN